MTARPPRPELRHAVLAQISAHTEEVEWAGSSSHLAFADSVIDWADWLAGTTPPPPPPRGAGSSRQAIDAALAATREAVDAARVRRTTVNREGAER